MTRYAQRYACSNPSQTPPDGTCPGSGNYCLFRWLLIAPAPADLASPASPELHVPTWQDFGKSRSSARLTLQTIEAVCKPSNAEANLQLHRHNCRNLQLNSSSRGRQLLCVKRKGREGELNLRDVSRTHQILTS